MIAKPKTTPKEAAIVFGKPVRDWTARRALHRIGLTAAVKQNKSIT